MADTLTYDGLEVCTDCAMMLANGELGLGDEGQDRAHATLIAERWPDTALVLTCSPEGGCCGFSWVACDGCGCTDGGDRHSAAGFAR